MRQGTLSASLLILALFPAAPIPAQEAASAAATIARQRCRPDQWVLLVEPNHSTVGFSIPIMGGITRVTGKFTEMDCVICYTDGDLAASSVTLVVQAESVDTGIEMRDRDLAGAKFFDVANTPEIVFESRRIELRGQQWWAVGDLTMRGSTHPVELPFVVTGLEVGESGRPVVGVALSAELNRRDYGVGSDWVHSAIPGFLGDEVTAEVFMYTRSGRRLGELDGS